MTTAFLFGLIIGIPTGWLLLGIVTMVRVRAGVRYFGFHAIRHYVASLLHDSKKISLPQVSKLLRHQSKATTERYLQVIDQSSRQAMQALEGEFFEKAPEKPSRNDNDKP